MVLPKAGQQTKQDKNFMYMYFKKIIQLPLENIVASKELYFFN